jgi:protein-S-isoprenylcysteine O-methyltransferase Ste14
MSVLLGVELLAFWAMWLYPFVFRAPHGQKRESIIARRQTLLGLGLELLAITIALNFWLPWNQPRGALRIGVSLAAGVLASILSWTSVTHLGRQFRITAGLYHDHKLVTTGPYAVVRHPIYSSFLAMLISTLALLTPLPWAAASLIVFIAGTEIRVHAEDALLASRFGDSFRAYRKSVPAYIPFVR